jgi:hypothetical protein
VPMPGAGGSRPTSKTNEAFFATKNSPVDPNTRAPIHAGIQPAAMLDVSVTPAPPIGSSLARACSSEASYFFCHSLTASGATP